MPKASEVATELRKLADSLDREPDAEIPAPGVYFPTRYEDKKAFLNVAAILPHPIKKTYPCNGTEIELEYRTSSIRVSTCGQRDTVCELIEPAKPAVYRCEPLLSEAEEAALETAVEA